MKRLVLLLLVVICVTSALGEQVFDDWVYPQESFDFDDRGANLQLGSSDTIRLILDNGENIIIALGSSKRFDQYLITYIAIDREVCDHSDCDPRRYGKINPTDFTVIPGINLNIEKLEPELDIDREFSETSVLLEDVITIDVTITNTGGALAQNLVYEDIFPAGLRVIDTTEGVIVNNGVKWTIGSLQENDYVSVRYKLKVEQSLEASLAAFIRYTYDDVVVEYNSPSKSVSTRELLEITTAQDPASPEMGEATIWTLALKNTNEDDPTDINLQSLVLEFPKELTVAKYSSLFRKDDDVYILEDSSIESGETLEYEFTLTSSEPVSTTINGTVKAFYKDILPTIPFEDTLSWKDTRSHSYEVEVFPDSRDYLEGTTARFRAILLNTDQNYDLVNGRINISYGGESRIFYVDRIEPNRAYTTDTWVVELPKVNKSISETGEVTFNFESEVLDDPLEETLSFKIGIKDISDAIQVTKDISDKTLLPNETARVTVTLENRLKDNSISGIYVEETVPEQFSARKIDLVEISLEDGESKPIYTYQVTAPFYFNESLNWLNTTVHVDDLVLESSSKIDIDIEKPDVSVSRNIQSSAKKGAVIQDPFKITNTGDVNVYNITFQQKAASGFDIVSGAEVPFVGELEPGESVTLQLPARLSKSGLVELGDATVYLNDVWGNKHTYDVDMKKITVDDAAVVEPLINMKRSVLTIANTKLLMEALLYNVGGSVATVAYFDENYGEQVTIKPGEFARITYDVEVSPTPSLTLDAPKATYEAQTRTWLSVGEPLQINRTLTSDVQNATNQTGASEEVIVLSQTGDKLFGSSKLSDIVGPGTIIAVLTITLVLGIVGFSYVRRKILRDKGRSEFDLLAEGKL